ncbi:MAG: HoxN/HupN/NixA family nickel/cobalt transporter [Nitrososphaera sp.]
MAPHAGSRERRTSLVGLTAGEKSRIILLFVPIVAATVLGFAASYLIGNLSLPLAGLGIAAFVFGLRHGVDADHIAAIDNTTRKLMQEGKRPLTVGTWFSLGHSTIVILLVVALIVSTRAIAGEIPSLQSIGSTIGTSISGGFLAAIGIVNVAIAAGVYRVYKQVHAGNLDAVHLEELLNKRGILVRYFGPLFKLVRKPWQIYPVGILFGLGFDTASEVALIAISVGIGVSSTIPMWMILILPFMFTCGMVLVDTLDSVTMRLAYGWAFVKPIRKVYYNLTITIISVLVALVIGGVELLQVLSGQLKLAGTFWTWLANLDFETLGYALIGIFAVSWLVSIAIYKLRRIENTAGA